MKEYYCPFCNKKLYEKYDGLVCRNWGCELYWKLGKGWVLRTGEDRWTLQRGQVNAFYKADYRLWAAKQFAEIRKKVLIRDNYTCQKCHEFKLGEHFVPPIQVHHIIPASEEMAMYLDMKNLITLCDKCHKELHSLDKNSFSNGKVNK